MNKLKAFLVHLGISAVIFVILLGLIVFVWYPHPYFTADGGWQGIRIVVLVDLVVGPLLTLIVFKRGKRGLKLDLAIIALIQACCLAWGVHVVYAQRPVAVVFADHGFYSLTSAETRVAGPKALAILRGQRQPAYAFVDLPHDKKARLAQELKVLSDGLPLNLRGNLYAPLDSANMRRILHHGLDMRVLVKDRPADQATLERFLADRHAKLADFAFVPLVCRYAILLLAIERANGRIVDSLAINPAPLFYP